MAASEYMIKYGHLPPFQVPTEVDQEAKIVIFQNSLIETRNPIGAPSIKRPEDLYRCLLTQEGILILAPRVDAFGFVNNPTVGQKEDLKRMEDDRCRLDEVVFYAHLAVYPKFASQFSTLTATLDLKFPPRQALAEIHALTSSSKGFDEAEIQEIARFQVRGRLIEPPI